MTSIGNLGMGRGANIQLYWIPGADVDGVHRQYNPIKKEDEGFFWCSWSALGYWFLAEKDPMQDFPRRRCIRRNDPSFSFFPSLNGMSIEPARERGWTRGERVTGSNHLLFFFFVLFGDGRLATFSFTAQGISREVFSDKWRSYPSFLYSLWLTMIAHFLAPPWISKEKQEP